mgnify:CR=1 FL=1
MFKTWTATDDDLDTMARAVEGHLNEFAEEVVSVSYAIAEAKHHVLVVHRPVNLDLNDEAMEAVLTVAEEIVEQAQV